MSVISVRLPETLHKQLREVAKKEGVSINQLIASAVGEKLTALITEDYIEKRASRYNAKEYLKAIRSISSREPEEYDKL